MEEEEDLQICQSRVEEEVELEGGSVSRRMGSFFELEKLVGGEPEGCGLF